MAFMMLANSRSKMKNDNSQMNNGRTEAAGDTMEDMEMRRGRRSYSQGYEDAMRDSERMEEMRNKTMSRMRSEMRQMEEELEARRGRYRSQMSPLGTDKERMMAFSYGGEMAERSTGGKGTDPDTSWQNPEKMGNDEHWKPRQIGFGIERDEMAEMKADIKQMKEMQKELMKGFASVKETSPKLGKLLDKSADLLANPPKTWPPYLQRDDIHGIVKMELEELYEAMKEKKPAKEVQKELSHVLGAIMLLCSE